jgi:glyoxylase-like metal-dependent hydrolase (beta-lactamase superfamily II)
MHVHSRRNFLAAAAGACGLLEQSVLRAAQARAQSRTAPSTLFDIQRVAPGVYAAIARPAALINCNAAIFENASDLMVVDTHSKPSAVAALVAQIRREIGPKPVRYVVNTHFHWDHSQGTPAYKRLSPAAQVVASEATRRLLADNGAARLRESVEAARKSLDEMQAKAGTTKTSEEKDYWQRQVAEAKAYIAEMQNYAPELPNVTFDRDLTVRDKSHSLQLAWRGRGHTSGDVVVWCPEKRVIATGDLLHGFAPYIPDGYPREWPNTLIAMTEFQFDRVIGGHGAVQEGKRRFYDMGTYIQDLVAVVQEARRRGRSLEQVQSETTPGSLASLRDGYGAFFAGQLMKFTPQAPGTTEAEVLGAAVKSNLAGVWDRI